MPTLINTVTRATVRTDVCIRITRHLTVSGTRYHLSHCLRPALLATVVIATAVALCPRSSFAQAPRLTTVDGLADGSGDVVQFEGVVRHVSPQGEQIELE